MQLPIPEEQAAWPGVTGRVLAQLAEIATTCKVHRPVLHAWAAAHGQLKLSLTANESSQEAIAFFFISLGLTVACELLPGYGRLKDQNGQCDFKPCPCSSLQRGVYSRGTELVSIP